MKHVFIINSHTTFFTAVGCVDFLKLSQPDILFIYVRNYKNSIMKCDWETVDLSQIFADYPAPRIWRERKLRTNFIRIIDEFVSSNIKSNYKLYAPHYGHPFFQAFYSNQRCVYGSYIQEGGIPFKNTYIVNPPIKQKVLYWAINSIYLRTKRVWMPHEWYYKGILYKQNKIDSFATSDSFFHYLPSDNHIVKWPKISVNVDIEDNSTIFIFDGFVFHHFVESDFYLECCHRMIVEDSSPMNYLRFHPAQSEEEKEKILSYFREINKKYEIMDTSIPFETIILCNKHLKIAGLGSSLLFFARDLDHSILCHDRWLSKSVLYKRYKKVSGFLYFDET